MVLTQIFKLNVMTIDATERKSTHGDNNIMVKSEMFHAGEERLVYTERILKRGES